MHAPPIMWRAWGRGMPRVIGRLLLRASAGSPKRNADPASPAIVIRQPRTRESFHPSAVGVAGGVQASGRSSPLVPDIPSAWPGLSHLHSRRLGRSLIPTLDRIAAASLNGRARLPSCGGDEGIIRQVRRCRITFPDFSRTFSQAAEMAREIFSRGGRKWWYRAHVMQLPPLSFRAERTGDPEP